MENRSSSTAESEKMLKIGFRPWPTSGKQQKLCFGHGRNAENDKKCVSAVADERKTTKIGFRPRPTSGKQQKHCFGRGRNAENDKKCVSATAERSEYL